MGLDDLKPFNPKEKIIEYMLTEHDAQPLINMKLNEFADETASESPAPGGGSISAYAGVLGVSLGTMVANLSSHKRGWDDRWEEFSNWAEKGMEYQKTLLQLVDEDTASFNKIMDAFGMPKGTEEEVAIRNKAIQVATKYATEVPFKVMEVSFKSMEVMKAMAEFGNPNSVTDAGVGALCARTAVRGALLNVKINASGLDDKKFANEILAKGDEIADKAKTLEDEIMEVVASKL
jgi:glutamate formiminotransferase/formiminotetrahydrofolate cyclodeaminase